MHAADAVHGDLGIIQKDDIVIAISKSGNTPEIKLLAPLLRQYGQTLIAMVGNTDSELARLADFVINTTVDKEACPNNLAPTTSTTAQLIMGDALAVALLKMRDFTGTDFSRYHPGGSLGKRLYLRCGELAAKNQKPQTSLTAPLIEAIQEISAGRLGATAVLHPNQSVAGIITDGDLRRAWEKITGNSNTMLAQHIMSPNPITADHDMLAADAAKLMIEKKISQLIITGNDHYVGMVHIHDLNREGIL
jgi:arabinose-5-phosphate isomerase